MLEFEYMISVPNNYHYHTAAPPLDVCACAPARDVVLKEHTMIRSRSPNKC